MNHLMYETPDCNDLPLKISELLNIVKASGSSFSNSSSNSSFQNLYENLLLDLPTYGERFSDMMNIGISLYNECRHLHPDSSSLDSKRQVLLMRHLACRIMQHSRMKNLDDSIDILRSLVRTGMLMLEKYEEDNSPKNDLQIKALKCFNEAESIWLNIGISFLCRTFQGLQLEEIIEDVWDLLKSKLEIIIDEKDTWNQVEQILKEIEPLVSTVEYLHEPFLDVLNLVIRKCQNYDWKDEAIKYLNQSLHTIEAASKTFQQRKKIICKKHDILNQLAILFTYKEEFQKAISCLDLIEDDQNEDSVLLRLKLTIKLELPDEANRQLQVLISRYSFTTSLKAARVFAAEYKICDTVYNIYHALSRDFPENVVQIQLELIQVILCTKDPNMYPKAREILENIEEMKTQTVGQSISEDESIRIYNVIHEAVCSFQTSGELKECIQWSELGIRFCIDDSRKARMKRIMSFLYVQSQDFNLASSLAREAIVEEPSKRSLFAYFRVLVANGNGNVDKTKEIERILKELIKRDDFELYDLTVFGKECYKSSNEKAILLVLEDIFENLLGQIERKETPTLKIGLVLQNIAQCKLKSSREGTLVNSLSIEDASKYAELLLHILKTIEITKLDVLFGPLEILEWFYGVCYNTGVLHENKNCLLKACSICRYISLLNKKYKSNCQSCLLAVVCIHMKKFEELDQEELNDLINCVTEFEAEDLESSNGISDDDRIFMVKVNFFARIKRGEFINEELFETSKAQLADDPESFMELGDFVLYAMKQIYSDQSRLNSLKQLATCIFKHVLQMRLQQNGIQPSSVICSLKHLITLSSSKKDAFHWFDQFHQLRKSYSIQLSENELEWFVGKAWNYGVSCYRNEEHREANEFMTYALNLVETSDTLSKTLGHRLSEQYTKLLDDSSASIHQ